MIAVLFEAKAAPAHQARYLQLAAELKPLLAVSTALSISNGSRA